MTDEGVALAKHVEGLRLIPYLCQAGYPTQGYGHRVPSLKVPPITVERAEQMLREDLAVAEQGALHLAPNLARWPRRLAALTDLVFNVGQGALDGADPLKPFDDAGVVRMLRAENWPAAAARFRRWDKYHNAKGELVDDRSLTERRNIAARWIEEGP